MGALAPGRISATHWIPTHSFTSQRASHTIPAGTASADRCSRAITLISDSARDRHVRAAGWSGKCRQWPLTSFGSLNRRRVVGSDLLSIDNVTTAWRTRGPRLLPGCVQCCPATGLTGLRRYARFTTTGRGFSTARHKDLDRGDQAPAELKGVQSRSIARGWCEMHHERWRLRSGSPNQPSSSRLSA